MVTDVLTARVVWPQGDRLAVAKKLPMIRVGDYIMVVDAGAYTLSMYSR